MAQETQSYNWVLKLNLYLYIYFQLFVFFAWLLNSWNFFAGIYDNENYELLTCFIYAVAWMSLPTQHSIHNIFKYTENDYTKP